MHDDFLNFNVLFRSNTTISPVMGSYPKTKNVCDRPLFKKKAAQVWFDSVLSRRVFHLIYFGHYRLSITLNCIKARCHVSLGKHWPMKFFTLLKSELFNTHISLERIRRSQRSRQKEGFIVLRLISHPLINVNEIHSYLPYLDTRACFSDHAMSCCHHPRRVH